ncbi:probable 28S ribosomal protein S25, mitochondrial [Cimex lectularius]|uniref:Small ribosomal subunit protein mS25 n=1 Tax=Cimex lectularius TaxID=79782 RepID=A0A8I6TJQ1_CIMLE|nr:probable 28S ribosomal protein S25, mitochondrial [Cimex lectularius]
MPFMKGPAPVRRTLKYLEKGRLFFKEGVKICSINYNTSGQHHEGARDFAFWYLPQLQYRNPNVQIITFKNMTPTPFLRFYFDTGDEMLVDIFGKKKEDIMEHLLKVIGKSKEVLRSEEQAKEMKDNPANFGYGCQRHCICELPGQVPCPRIVPLPEHMRGKFINKKD